MVTKKQHYYPRTLLKHFANEDSKLYTYIVKSDSYVYLNYENVCYKKYTYETSDKVDNILENELSKYEGDFSRVVDYILKNMFSKDFNISNDYVDIIWKYFFLQDIRTDSGRMRFVQNLEKPNKSERRYPVESGEIEQNKNNIEKFNRIFKQPDSLSKLLKSFSKPPTFKFHISISIEDYFITSDNPVVSTYGKNKESGFQLIMPISPFVCLTFQMGDLNCSENLIVKMTDEKIKYINEAQINTANYFIISLEPFSKKQKSYIKDRYKNRFWIKKSRHFQ